MTRLNLVLLSLLMACSRSLVRSRHQSRKLTTELTGEQAVERAFEIEHGQLSLEQPTLSRAARVEKVAREALRLQHPGPGRVEIVDVPAGK